MLHTGLFSKLWSGHFQCRVDSSCTLILCCGKSEYNNNYNDDDDDSSSSNNNNNSRDSTRGPSEWVLITISSNSNAELPFPFPSQRYSFSFLFPSHFRIKFPFLPMKFPHLIIGNSNDSSKHTRCAQIVHYTVPTLKHTHTV